MLMEYAYQAFGFKTGSFFIINSGYDIGDMIAC